MATFAPSGFRSLYSHSNSSMAQSGVEEFPFPTTGGWYGFAGDIAVQNFYVPDTGGAQTELAPSGFVYPCPTGLLDVVASPIVGVFEGFKYTPLGQPGLTLESTNFIPGTPIQPGTQVMAVVRVDLQGVFQVQAAQVNGGDGTVQYSDILTGAPILAVNTYNVTLANVPNTPNPNPVNALNFPMGDTGLNGLSGVYWQSNFQAPGYDMLGTTFPFRLIGTVNPDDYTTSTSTVNNPQVKVRIDGLNIQSFVR